MKIKTLIAVAALSFAAMAAPTTTFADDNSVTWPNATPFCHTRALNGDVLDPPVCNEVKGVVATGGEGPIPAGTPPCTKTGTESPCLM